jgi:hypothetical protein
VAKAKKGYPVGLAGESNYQAAICICRAGETVSVCHEIGNPHDENALVVLSNRGEKIGYIPRSSWLRDAIHEEGKGCEATILSIEGEREPMGVVIDVRLTDDELEIRDYVPDESSSKVGSSGCLVALAAVPAVLLITAVGSLA